MRVAAIVEGDGEVQALPVLLRRFCAWLTPDAHVEVLAPIRVRKERFLNCDDEFHRYLELAAWKCQADGWVLVLLDADDDCPAQCAAAIDARIRRMNLACRHSVILANREYEAWFIAAASSLHGHRGFRMHSADACDAETPRNCKGWLAQRMSPGKSYSEITDQPALTAIMDLELAASGSRSFRKLCKEWSKQVVPDP